MSIGNKIIAAIVIILIVGATAYGGYIWWKNANAPPEPRIVEEGDTVTMTYTGYLNDARIYNGTRVFDTSDPEIAEDEDILKIVTFDNRTRTGSFSFTVGEGEVIRGWDLRIMDMKENESAIWKIPASEAYEPRVDDLVRSIPLKEEVHIFEYMTMNEFKAVYGESKLKEGLEINNNYYGWRTNVYDVNEAGNNITLYNMPLKGQLYTCSFGWSIKIETVDQSANGGEGKIVFTHIPALGDTVSTSKIAERIDGFDDISSIQQSKQGQSGPGIVTGVTATQIELDFNREVYGRTLTFHVTLTKIEKPGEGEEGLEFNIPG